MLPELLLIMLVYTVRTSLLSCIPRINRDNVLWALTLSRYAFLSDVNKKFDAVLFVLVFTQDETESTGITDMLQNRDVPIVDHYKTKECALKLAADAAVTVLRVDQIIMSRPAGGPKPRKIKCSVFSSVIYCLTLCVILLAQQSGNWDQD